MRKTVSVLTQTPSGSCPAFFTPQSPGLLTNVFELPILVKPIGILDGENIFVITTNGQWRVYSTFS